VRSCPLTHTTVRELYANIDPSHMTLGDNVCVQLSPVVDDRDKRIMWYTLLEKQASVLVLN
jgi:hypothetical protein